MNEKLFKETFSCLRASDASKRELLEMTERNETDPSVQRKRHALRRRVLAIAAAVAVLCALTVTALAAGGYLGNWRPAKDGSALLTNGTYVGLLAPDDTPEDDTDNEINLPSIYMGERVWVENGRVLLTLRITRGDTTLFARDLDITDELAASPDGTYAFVETGSSGDASWSYDFVVKPGWVSEWAEAEGDGYGYVISGIREASFRWQDSDTHTGSSGGIRRGEGDDAWEGIYGVWSGMDVTTVPQTWRPAD